MPWLQQHLPPEASDFNVASTAELFAWLHSHRSDGQALVRRVARRVVMQEFLSFDLKRQMKGIYARCQEAGVQFDSVPLTESDVAPLIFACPQCSREFSTAQGLQAHKWRKHHQVSEERKFIFDTTCRACNWCFWTVQSLQQHLRWSRRHVNGCFATLQF